MPINTNVQAIGSCVVLGLTLAVVSNAPHCYLPKNITNMPTLVFAAFVL